MVDSSIFSENAIGKEFRIRKKGSASLLDILVLMSGGMHRDKIYIEERFPRPRWCYWLPIEDIIDVKPLDKSLSLSN